MRILLVEDEADLANAICRALRREGYSVDWAAQGEDGLFKAVEVDYDAVLLDVMLPGCDGWAVLAALRKAKRTPVLMLTARDATADRVRGLDDGADDYLTKPFELPELLARIRALIRRATQHPARIAALGDVRIDFSARQVARDGAAVILTGREYSILEYLALHRGQLVSRTDLHDHVLDESDDTMSNLIDVHISGLRKKLGHDLIKTRRGLGYLIE